MNYLYVDNSNIAIEAMHMSAVAKGLAASITEAQQKDITDRSYKLDFGRLLEFAGGEKSQIGRAVLYGSRPPPNDSVWNAAKRKGFEVVVHDRSLWTGKEKKIDTNVVTDIVTDSFDKMKPATDEITLVAGDADYVPMVESLRKRGFRVDACFWEHASGELRRAVTKFIALNPFLDHLRLK